MAKRSILGVMTGKLGNMVGQSNSLVSSKDKQVWRVYKGNVKNPKTVKQALQRALFVAAKNFRVALAKLLDHSWQGVDYGTKSLNHFESMVLANGGANYPGFIIQPKGSQDAIPQPFPVSRGSIPFDTTLTIQDVGEIEVNGIAGISGSMPATVGAVWQAILALNPQLKDGDMITIVAFISTEDHTPSAYSSLYPVYDRFIINTNDTSAYVDYNSIASQKGIFTFDADDVYNGHATVRFDDVYCAACAIIISRQKGAKAQWQRSNSDMQVSGDFTTWLMTQDYVNETLDSYMQSTANAESDWYLNETGDNNNGQTADPGIVDSITLNLSNGSTTPGASYSYKNKQGFLFIPAGNGGGASHNTIKYTISGMTITPVELAAGVYITGPNDGVYMTDVFNILVSKGYNVTLLP